MDWDKAEKRIRDLLDAYNKASEIPHVNVSFAVMALKLLLHRYEGGDRTVGLYNG